MKTIFASLLFWSFFFLLMTLAQAQTTIIGPNGGVTLVYPPIAPGGATIVIPPTGQPTFVYPGTVPTPIVPVPIYVPPVTSGGK